MNTPVYDSSKVSYGVASTIRTLWDYRLLVQVLVSRDIKVRYKRSVLGIGWTLINPLITSLVLWFVFSKVFAARLTDGAEFAPFVLAGILVITFFSQGLTMAADSVASGSGILTKVYVPPQVFPFASAIGNAINFSFGLIALGVVSILTADGISITFPLVAVVMASLVLLVTGGGLLLSIAYIRFDDSRNIITVVLLLMNYLSPVFYPKAILGDTMRTIVNLNPLTSYLECFRWAFSTNGVATAFDWVYMVGSAIVVFVLGVRVFARQWPKIVAML